jgi:hypothetical protein
MSFRLAQSWFGQNTELVTVVLEPCSSHSCGNSPIKKEEKNCGIWIFRFLVIQKGKLIVASQTSLVYALLAQRLRKVFRVAGRCSLDHLVLVLADETCVGLANDLILRKSNALTDGITRVGASFAMLYVAQVRCFRLITY